MTDPAQRCPGCRGRLAQELSCPRCGCDLALVRRAEAQGRQLLVRAVQAWARGDEQQARSLADAAQRLQFSPLAAGLLKALSSH